MIKTIACAAVVVSALAASTMAEAGGKRLQFGFPLGSFTATPAKGGGASKAYAHKAKKDAVKQAARKAEPKRERVAKQTPAPVPATEPVTEKVTAVEQDAPPRLTGSSALVEQSLPPETPKDDAAAKTSDAAASEGGKAVDAACTKFVPAIGTTVAVECGK